MARVVKNPFGELSGKVGVVVFKTGKNGAYISSLPEPSRQKPSILQELQRLKMTTVMDFLKPLQQLLKVAYFPFESNKSGFHAAKSYYLKEVVKPEDNHFVIQYSKALVSFGNLRPIADLQLIPDVASHSIIIQWRDNSDQAMAYADDALLLVYYAPEKKQLRFKTDVAFRAAGTATLNLGALWADTPVHIWAGFMRHDKASAAASCYGGIVIV